MAEVNIYHMSSRRPQAIEILVYFLKKVKNKDKFKFFFLCDYDINTKEHDKKYDDYAAILSRAGVNVEVRPDFGPHRNYMSKIEFALAQDAPYSIKLDEDCFMSENVIDFMIENREMLNNPRNYLMTPVLSNGIPTCDYFLQDFLAPHEIDEIGRYFLPTSFTNMWGVDYRFLNKHTVNAKHWDFESFYNSVSTIGPAHGNNHFFKGIHPVRVNYQANRRINDFIVGKWDKFCTPPKSSMHIMHSQKPYFCNSVFMMKTSVWRDINSRKDLFRDDYDEVPLNLYRQEKRYDWLFIRNGYALHTIYNTVQRYDYENEIIAYITNLVRGREESGI